MRFELDMVSSSGDPKTAYERGLRERNRCAIAKWKRHSAENWMLRIGNNRGVLHLNQVQDQARTRFAAMERNDVGGKLAARTIDQLATCVNRPKCTFTLIR